MALAAVTVLSIIPVFGVVLRRLVKQYVFWVRDRQRLRWAQILTTLHSEAGRRTRPRFPWEKVAAEEVLLQRATTGPEAERVRARRLFREWGLWAVRRKQLRRGSSAKRAYAALVLGRMQCNDVLGELARFLQRSQPECQVAALNALELLADPRAIPFLMGFSAQKEMCRTRPVMSALIACGRSGPQQLTPFLSHPVAEVRSLAAGALAEVATHNEVPVLLAAASDREPEVRAKVARALGRAEGHEGCMAVLERLLVDPVWYVRLQAAGALGRMRSDAALPALRKATRDTNWQVRERAAYALYELVGDPVWLFAQLCQTESDAYVLGGFVTALERRGVIWQAIDSVCSPDHGRRLRAQALIAALARVNKVTSILYAIERHNDPGVREELGRLLQQRVGKPALAGRQPRPHLAAPSTQCEPQVHL